MSFEQWWKQNYKGTLGQKIIEDSFKEVALAAWNASRSLETQTVDSVIVKKFGVDFHSAYGALTLASEEVSDQNVSSGVHERTHDDGWTIKGQVHEDYYVWVNEFEAHHPVYGRVWGDFESEVYADSEEGFVDFYMKHTPDAWDYADI